VASAELESGPMDSDQDTGICEHAVPCNGPRAIIRARAATPSLNAVAVTFGAASNALRLGGAGVQTAIHEQTILSGYRII
jgi:hypothetical protein